MSIKKYALCGGGIGFAVTVLAIVLAGAGHGSYIPSCLFFAPLVFFGWYVVFLGGGILLYVGYAILMGWGNRRNKGVRILLILALLHFGAVGLSVWVVPEAWDYEYLKKSFRLAPIFTVASFVPFTLALVVSVYAAVKPRPEQNDAPQCRKCSYNLTGNTSGICPECGEPIQPEPDEGGSKR